MRFFIHIGAPRTGTTVLQKHLFQNCRNKLVFSKIGTSGEMVEGKRGIGGGDPNLYYKYVKSLSPGDKIDNFFFARRILFTTSSFLAHNPKIRNSRRIFTPIMDSGIAFLEKHSNKLKKDIFISSERLCETDSSFVCNSIHSKFEWEFSIFPLCRRIQIVTNNLPMIIVVMRDPFPYLRSKYLRTTIQRRLTGKRFITPTEFIEKQANLEEGNPGTSALTPAMHSTFLKVLQKNAFVKSIGFQQLLRSDDVFSLLGLLNEGKFAFKDFPRENKLNFTDAEEQQVQTEIKSALKKYRFYEDIKNSQLFE